MSRANYPRVVLRGLLIGSVLAITAVCGNAIVDSYRVAIRSHPGLPVFAESPDASPPYSAHQLPVRPIPKTPDRDVLPIGPT